MPDEEIKDNEQEGLKSDDQDGKDEEQYSEEEMVKISPDAYAALLDRLTELEAKQYSPRRSVSPKETDVDGLVGELDEEEEEVEDEEKPQKRQQRQITVEQLDGMTNSQLVGFLTQNLDGYMSKAMMPLMTRLEKMRVNEELREARSSHEDFDDYSDKVYRIARANPSLSIEDAYLLAKGRVERLPKSGDTVKSKGKAHRLPPRPVFGEKPGPSRRVAQENPKTVNDAAERAYEEVMKKTK